MKKLLFSMALVAGFSVTNAQTVLFEDDFESYEDFAIDGIGDWIMVDVDGLGTYSGGGGTFPNQFDPKAFMVFNFLTAGVTNESGGTENRNFDPVDFLDKYMGAWASSGGANDDWMISPAITLGASENTLEFVHKSLSDTYGYEVFNVLVYAGDGTPLPGDFTMLSEGEISDSWETWLTYTANLDAYANQTVRIAIQCVSDDAYMFMVDNFKVTTGNMGVADANTKNISTVYPNPVVDSFNLNLSSKFNANNVTVTVTDLTGKTVKTFTGVSAYNVSELATGVYVVTITDGKNTETKKIVKK